MQPILFVVDVVEALSSPIVGYSDLARTIERDYPQSAGAIYPKSDGKY